MNCNMWARSQFPAPPMMRGQGPGHGPVNWQNSYNRPIVRYDMGPFDMAPRGMRPGGFPNGGPRMMNMQGCRPPNPTRFAPQNGPPQGHGGQINQVSGGPPQQGMDAKELNPHGQQKHDQNGRGKFSNGQGNNFRVQNNDQFHDSRNPRKRPFQHGTGPGNGFGERDSPRFQGNGNGNKKKKKVQKFDKRDLEENNQFCCDICERGFKTEEKFKEHTDNHAKCTYENCSYVAAPKLVQLHVKLQHNSGLANKIWSLDSKEDIEKWRAARRKNFPTAENIAKKKAESACRVARGEVLETKEFGKMKGRNRNRGPRHRNNDTQQNVSENGRKRKGQMTEDTKVVDGKKAKTEDSKVNVPTEEKSQAAENGQISTGDPLSVLLRDSDSDSEEERDTVAEPGGKLRGGLGMILSSYVIDTPPSSPPGTPRGTTEEAQEVEKEKICDDKTNTDNPRGVSGNRRGHISRRGNATTRQTAAGKGKWKNNKLFNNTKSSLLEKLLANEIRHERNVILQCVHYIVQNKFFGAGHSSSNTANKTNGTETSEQTFTPPVIDDSACM